jgi:PAS domain S-box-containing protein
MKNEKAELNQNSDLRHQAEERLIGCKSDPTGFEGEGKDARALVHELQVHQIELEMQNEELKLAKLETENALMKYSDLYDFAPIGLFALDAQGLIQEVNLVGAKLLGMERRNLMNGKHFQLFVAPKDRPFFDDFCKKAFETSIKQTCELNLLRDGKPTVYARIEGIVAEDGSTNGRQCRIAAIDITERKKAMREIESQAKFPDEDPNPVLRIAADCTIIYANRGSTLLLEQWGCQIGQKLPYGYRNLIPETLRSGNCSEIEIMPGGIAYSLVFVPIADLGYVNVYGKNITDRKRAEDAIRETHDYLKSLIDYANAPIIVWDPSFRITRFNHAFERLTGLRAAEALGEPLNILFPESSSLESLEHIRGTLSGERWDVVEIPILNADGSIRTVLWNSANIYDGNGTTIIATIAQGQDITDRKLAETALRESEQLYRAIGESIDYGVWVCDTNGRNIYSSESFLKLVGITQEQCSNFGWGDTLHPDDTERTIAAWKECVRNEGTWDIEHRFLGVDGKWHDILARGVPVRNERGEVTCWAGINLDISRIKHAEKELHKAKDELELRVQERTADLVKINQQLTQAKETAEEATQAKSNFMANMSHEIRTPMNAVLGMTSLLLYDESLNDEQKDFIETIRISGDALMVVINDILDFSKMEQERVVLEEQPFNLHNCIEESIDLVSACATEKHLNLATIIDRTIPEKIIGDPNRLRQILVNLLGNAVKFTESGEVKLNVSGHQLDGNYEIHFAIADTGIGISNEKMYRLFQPFSQVNASITRNYGGTGLGLVIAKKLVELMEGRIWVESEFGKGSTFHFTIIAAIAPIQTEKQLLGAQSPLVGKNVLIVNDNRSNRRILGEYAYSWGMVPLIASNSQDALNWIRRGSHFDVAMLDIDLPKMDGATLAKEIRKIDKTMPLVLLTSIDHQMASDIIDAYLIKPVKPAQLHKVLICVLSRKSAQAGEVNQKTQIRPMHILLAEDNVSSQKVVRQMIKRLGCTVDVAANGIEALQALERQPYDLVLMDLRMPEMDGLEATRIIRQLWPDNGPKIIAITAYALLGDREKCLDAGMDDYISKPVRIEELAEVLKKYRLTQDGS